MKCFLLHKLADRDQFFELSCEKQTLPAVF